MKDQLVFTHPQEDGDDLVCELPDDSMYGVAVDGKQYMAYYHPPARLGGYLDHNIIIACGFGAACAMGYHPHTLCSSLEEAKERCQRHYDSRTNERQ